MLTRHRALRRGGAVVLATLAAAALTTVASTSAAHADDSAKLLVVGTSDVFDSNLVTDVIKPGFEAQYPQYTLNYVSKGTGAAIDFAETGTPSALIVHAASLENQFVGQGYSLENFGRAVFWGDYVLLGPKTDPAGVLAADKHNIAGAFEKIAAAGALGKADFVSRGGTPGTTVQEHAIWALTQGSAQCSVSTANGGGTSPSTTSGACSDSISYPSWYHATGLTQAPNIVNADTCDYPSGPDDCYVLTDRGTYEYLVQQGEISKLGIMVRGNDASAPGGGNLLVNSFHAYAVNPAKFSDPNVHINTAAATALLNWLTSPAGQAEIGSYLNQSKDAPFIPDAAPKITTQRLPARVIGGNILSVTGTLTNVVPGTPALQGQSVYLQAAPPAHPLAKVEVAQATVDINGHFSIDFVPRANRIYSVDSHALTQLENDTLNPVFGDLLAATHTGTLGTVGVLGKPAISSIVGGTGVLKIKGTVAPTVSGTGAHLNLFARRLGTSRQLHFIAQRSLKNGATGFTAGFPLRSGKWAFTLTYGNPGVIVAGSTVVRRVTIN